jgi:putative glutamine transport system substrate-binding protein
MHKFVSLLIVASAVGCGESKSAPSGEAAAKPTDTTPTAVAPAPAGDGTALYDLDTDPQKAPAPGSAMDRILKGLHVRVCVRADVAPFGSFSTGGLEGLEIELATEIVKQISIDYKQALKIDWTVVTAGERIKRLEEDGCDLEVAALSYSAERAAQVGTSKVYLKTDKVLMAAKDIKRKVPVIAKVGGTTGDTGDLKGTPRSYSSYQEIVYAMDNDEIDYLVTDRPIAEQLIRSSTKPYAITKTLAQGAESYVAATNKSHTDVLAAVDKALEDLAKSGRLALMHRRWL